MHLTFELAQPEGEQDEHDAGEHGIRADIGVGKQRHTQDDRDAAAEHQPQLRAI